MTREEIIFLVKEYKWESDDVFTAITILNRVADDFESREKALLKEIEDLKGFKLGDALPKQSLLKEMFDYVDGELIWKIKKKGSKGIGSISGSIYNNGYKNLMLNGRRYGLHRLIWIYHYGDIEDGLEIDHIDGNRSNNHVDNLRNVSRQENCFNRTTSKGYCFDKTYGKFKAYIKIDGKGKHLGHFDTEIEAEKAYLDAKNKYHQIREKTK